MRSEIKIYDAEDNLVCFYESLSLEPGDAIKCFIEGYGTKYPGTFEVLPLADLLKVS